MKSIEILEDVFFMVIVKDWGFNLNVCHFIDLDLGAEKKGTTE